MDDVTAGNIELSKMFDLYTYLDDAVTDRGYENKSLQYIVDNLYSRVQAGDNTLTSDQRNSIELMHQALQQHSDWGNAILRNTSSYDAIPGCNSISWTDDSIQAATFELDGDYYMSFRGTGDGRWTDNAMGMTGMSPMQYAAVQYYNQMVGDLNLDQIDGNIYVGGHSKGGDESQVIMMCSPYGDLIDGVYSIDGQGLPPDLVAYLKRNMDPAEYQARLDRMYSICGEYDPVHQMGIVIIPDGNTYYLAVDGDGLLPWHDMKYMFGNEVNGVWTYHDLKWQIDPNTGAYLNGTPQYTVEFAKGLNAELMKLDRTTRDSVARTMMYLIDLSSGSYLSDPRKIPNGRDVMDFLFFGVPMITSELLFTPEGRQTLESLIGVLVDSLSKPDALGPTFGPIVSAIIVAAGTLLLAPVLLTLTVLGEIFKIDVIYDAFIKVCEKIAEIGQKVYDFLKPVFDLCGRVINNFVNYIRQHSYSYRYCCNNPQLVVNPETLEAYANRIDRVNTRLKNVESRIKDLYDEVDFLDMSWVQGADMKIGESSKLRKCSEYLNYTASEFRNAEYNINHKLLEVF